MCSISKLVFNFSGQQKLFHIQSFSEDAAEFWERMRTLHTNSPLVLKTGFTSAMSHLKMANYHHVSLKELLNSLLACRGLTLKRKIRGSVQCVYIRKVFKNTMTRVQALYYITMKSSPIPVFVITATNFITGGGVFCGFVKPSKRRFDTLHDRGGGQCEYMRWVTRSRNMQRKKKIKTDFCLLWYRCVLLKKRDVLEKLWGYFTVGVEGKFWWHVFCDGPVIKVSVAKRIFPIMLLLHNEIHVLSVNLWEIVLSHVRVYRYIMCGRKAEFGHNC